MKKLMLTCVAVGGIGVVSAGSYFGLLFFSGKHLQTAPIFSADRVQSSRSALAARRDPIRYTPMRVTLSPDMNPITASILVSISPGGVSSATAEYKVGVQTMDGDEITTGTVRTRRGKPGGTAGRRLSRSSSKTSMLHVMTFDVSEAGPYIIHVAPGERQGLSVTELHLRLRRNVATPNIGLMVGGIAAMFLAILGGMVAVLAPACRASHLGREQ